MPSIAHLVARAGGDNDHSRYPRSDEEIMAYLETRPNANVEAAGWGSRYNELPPNFVQIDGEQFAQQVTLMHPLMHQFRQPRFGQRMVGNFRLWWFSGGSGVALAHQYENLIAAPGVDGTPEAFNQLLAVQGLRDHFGQWYATFWKFAVCLHQDVGEQLGRCWWRYTCKHCGYVHEVDSSD